MNQGTPVASGEKIIGTMIELARCSSLHRIILAGSKSLSHMFELHGRGYNRVVTAESCALQRGRYDVGFADWRLQQIKALEAKLSWLAPFLAPTSVLVIWLDASERTEHRKLASILERLGFRVEAGTMCEQGIAISARRRDADQQAVAARGRRHADPGTPRFQSDGFAPALPRPFDECGRLDVPALDRFCDRQIHEGATALVVCGTTGDTSNF